MANPSPEAVHREQRETCVRTNGKGAVTSSTFGVGSGHHGLDQIEEHITERIASLHTTCGLLTIPERSLKYATICAKKLALFLEADPSVVRRKSLRRSLRIHSEDTKQAGNLVIGERVGEPLKATRTC